MPYITATDGARIHYDLHGTGPNEVILLHGMGSSSIWGPMVEHLDLGLMRIAALDWRGHGRSTAPDNQLCYPKLNDDVLSVADAVGFTRSVIVGFSGGCKNAVWLAAGNTDRVGGLVLVAPPGLGTVPVPREAIALFFDGMEFKGDAPPEFDSWFTEKIGSHRSKVVSPIAATPRTILEASANLWIHTSIAEEVRAVTKPVLLVVGAREAIYHPTYQQETTLKILPHATMHVLDCAHFIPYEEPAALAALITQFVITIPG
jgi:aminoacrylate hydrolase